VAFPRFLATKPAVCGRAIQPGAGDLTLAALCNRSRADLFVEKRPDTRQGPIIIRRAGSDSRIGAAMDSALQASRGLSWRLALAAAAQPILIVPCASSSLLQFLT
jgi:hypothetical protein